MSTESGLFFSREGVIYKGRAPRGTDSVLYLQPHGGGICLPFFRLYVYMLYALICYIFSHSDHFLKSSCLGKVPNIFSAEQLPTSFNNHFILPVKTPTPSLKMFLCKEGKRVSATQLHPGVECYSTTH